MARGRYLLARWVLLLSQAKAKPYKRAEERDP
jgi:hypothetical protein